MSMRARAVYEQMAYGWPGLALRRMGAVPRTWLYLILLALASGLLYACLLPPWGLVDEEQHFHYVQYLFEERRLPVVGNTYLSNEVVSSLFDTQRWVRFHWPTPPAQDPLAMGLEGHSYEAYQPPLYYTLLALCYGVFPGPILLKLFAFRWVMVGLSLATVWLMYGTVRLVLPSSAGWATIAATLLVTIPERAASVSRVNNDGLLEVLTAGVVFVGTKVLVEGITSRRSQLMGVLFGLSILTKTSAGILIVFLGLVAWMTRHSAHWQECALQLVVIPAAMVAPLVVRNMALYGDFTGFAGFGALNDAYGVVIPHSLTFGSLSKALVDTFSHFWVVWWKGASVGHNSLLSSVYILIALLTICSASQYARIALQRRGEWLGHPSARVLLAYGIQVAFCVYGVLVSYFGGRIPVIQGRFFLPVVVPCVCLVVSGLRWHPNGRFLAFAIWVLLAFLGILNLFGNLLPYHYYWSGATPVSTERSVIWCLNEVWRSLSANLVSDKPLPVQALLPYLPALYVAALTGAVLGIWRRELITCSLNPEMGG